MALSGDRAITVKYFQRELRTLGHVPRWGIVRRSHQQSVLEHSALVAFYADQLADIMDWRGDRHALFQYALWHDVEESFTTDIAHYVKVLTVDKKRWDKYVEYEMQRRFQRTFKNINPEVKAIVVCADMLEGALYLQSEHELGNRDIKIVYEDMWSNQLPAAVNKLPCDEPVRRLVRDTILDAKLDEMTGGGGVAETDVADLMAARYK